MNSPVGAASKSLLLITRWLAGWPTPVPLAMVIWLSGANMVAADREGVDRGLTGGHVPEILVSEIDGALVGVRDVVDVVVEQLEVVAADLDGLAGTGSVAADPEALNRGAVADDKMPGEAESVGRVGRDRRLDARRTPDRRIRQRDAHDVHSGLVSREVEAELVQATEGGLAIRCGLGVVTGVDTYLAGLDEHRVDAFLDAAFGADLGTVRSDVQEVEVADEAKADRRVGVGLQPGRVVDGG